MSHIDTPFETCSLDAGRTEHTEQLPTVGKETCFLNAGRIEGLPYAKIYPTNKLSRDLF